VPKLPRPTGAEMVRFLESQGFIIARVRGSHYVMERGTAHTTVPVHGAETLRIGTLRGILRDVELRPQQFVELWNQ